MQGIEIEKEGQKTNQQNRNPKAKASKSNVIR
jgi:hypothetical protein